MLFIILTMTFSFTSFYAFGKEYIMICEHNTYKLVDTLWTKELYWRSEGKWEVICDKKYDIKGEKSSTYIHKGDSAVCIKKYEDAFYKRMKSMKDEVIDQLLENTFDQIKTFDFILNITTTTYPKHKNKKKVTEICKKF